MFSSKKPTEEMKQEMEARIAEEAQKLRKEFEELGQSLTEQIKKVSSDLTVRVSKLDEVLAEAIKKLAEDIAARGERAQQIIDRDSVFMNTTIDEMDGVLKEARSSTANAHLKLAESITLLAKTLGASTPEQEALAKPAAKAPEPKPSKKKR